MLHGSSYPLVYECVSEEEATANSSGNREGAARRYVRAVHSPFAIDCALYTVRRGVTESPSKVWTDVFKTTSAKLGHDTGFKSESRQSSSSYFPAQRLQRKRVSRMAQSVQVGCVQEHTLTVVYLWFVSCVKASWDQHFKGVCKITLGSCTKSGKKKTNARLFKQLSIYLFRQFLAMLMCPCVGFAKHVLSNVKMFSGNIWREQQAGCSSWLLPSSPPKPPDLSWILWLFPGLGAKHGTALYFFLSFLVLRETHTQILAMKTRGARCSKKKRGRKKWYFILLWWQTRRGTVWPTVMSFGCLSCV